MKEIIDQLKHDLKTAYMEIDKLKTGFSMIPS